MPSSEEAYVSVTKGLARESASRVESRVVWLMGTGGRYWVRKLRCSGSHERVSEAMVD